MKRISPLFCALFAAVAMCEGGQVPDGLKASIDGSVHAQSALGQTKWTGAMKIEHERFTIEVRGCTTLFGGPSVQKKAIGRKGLQARELSVEFEWISLVALGDVAVTIHGPDGSSKLIRARRFVYVPAEDRILINGAPWDAPNDTETGPRPPPAGQTKRGAK